MSAETESQAALQNKRTQQTFPEHFAQSLQSIHFPPWHMEHILVSLLLL